MARVPLFVVLFCSIAEASPLSWNRDIFQSTGTFTSPQAYGAAADSIGWNAYSFITNVEEILGGVRWPLAPKIGGNETGASLDRDRSEFEVVPDTFTPFDLSSVLPDARPRLVWTQFEYPHRFTSITRFRTTTAWS